MQTLAGRTAVVTGGASGMGRAFCVRLARAGMRIVMADIEDAALQTAAAELAATGAEVLAVRCDVSRPEDHQAVLDAALDRFGQLNVVCLNAGVGGANGRSWTLSLEDWNWTLGVNLWGVVHGIRTFVPHLLSHGDGHVVTTASIAGHTSSPFGAPYNVTKHAVVTLTETLYNELQKESSSIGVTCLCPGFVHTNIIDSARNRPAGTGTGTGTAPRESGGSRFMEIARRMIENGKPPAEVADLVHDAIINNQFWLFTDEVWDVPIERRHQEILERRPPTMPTPRRR